MFEGVVSYLLNKYLSRYIANLDTESLNISVWSGQVELTDLALKPEALAALDLPVSVTRGTVGRIALTVPWTSLWSSPLVVSVEQVLVLAAPLAARGYDPELELRLERAAKRAVIARLERDNVTPVATDQPPGFFERLVATILKNVQVFVRNVHVRYEDGVSSPGCPLAGGICVQSISAETTNSKWKPAVAAADATSVFKLVRLESLSVYWNSYCAQPPLDSEQMKDSWRELMAETLNSFAVNDERLDFLVKPLSAKLKVIMNLSAEHHVPKLLVDLVLQDTSVQLSRQQYLSLINIAQSFNRMKVNSRYRQYRPSVPVRGNAALWWRYGRDAVVHEIIRPYSWQSIKAHRDRYREYRAVYLSLLEEPAREQELLPQLQRLEDDMDATGILLAREEARIRLAKESGGDGGAEEETGWWGWLTGPDTEAEQPTPTAPASGWTVWTQLTAEEKQQLYESIGLGASGDAEAVTTLPASYIKHKLNVTVSSLTASLLSRSAELLVGSAGRLVGSLESRPAARSLRLSASAQTLLMEGTSLERDLVPVVSVADVHESDHMPVFSLDFEVNPPQADFGLAVTVAPIEVVYSEHAVSEVLSFVQTPQLTLRAAAEVARERLSRLTEAGAAALRGALARRSTLQLSLDLASPYLVIPETGTLQSGGNLLVVDLGRLVVSSELRPALTEPALAEMSRAELEEALYDRYRFRLTDLQVLFADSGDEWRSQRRQPVSENHLLPKVQTEMVFSNSVQQHYTKVPRHKLDITVSACRLHLSDRRLRRLAEFAERLPPPRPLQYADTVDALPPRPDRLCLRECQMEPGAAELRRIRRQLRRQARPAGRDSPDTASAAESSSLASTTLSSAGAEVHRVLRHERGVLESEAESEAAEAERWARAVDQPGFHDNVSAHNTLSLMVRLQIPELTVHLDRSGDAAERPYLLLVVSSVSAELAQLRYGPAAQLAVAGLRLVDKLHATAGGEYLELVSTAERQLLTVRYRQVSSSCPEFSTVFHSVERSVVVDMGQINLLFHRGAVLTLVKFLQYAGERLPGRPASADLLPPALLTVAPPQDTVPTPAGATRLSASVRLRQVLARLCDTDSDLLEVKLAGAEIDLQLKANDKKVLKASIAELAVEDTSETTLYPKIISMEDDKLLELSVSLLSGAPSPLEPGEPVRPRGSVRLHVGRVHVLLLRRLVTEIQTFLAPFVVPELGGWAAREAERRVADGVAAGHRQAPTVGLSVKLLAPRLVIPGHSRSRQALLVNLGDLSVENLVQTRERPSRHVVDSIMVRLTELQISRAKLTVSGDLEVLDPILAPAELRVDVQRCVQPVPAGVMPLTISASLDLLTMDVAQSDVTLVYTVLTQNLAEGHWSEESWRTASPELAAQLPPSVDEMVGHRLQAFLSGEVRPEATVTVTIDGATIVLYEDGADCGGAGSPSRGEAAALLRCELGEARLQLDQFSDRSLSSQLTLQKLTLADARPDSPAADTRILERRSEDALLEATLERAASGDRTARLLVCAVRLTLSVPFLALVHDFFSRACPQAPAAAVGPAGVPTARRARAEETPSSSEGSTSGYLSAGRSAVQEDLADLTVTAQLRGPEVVLLVDPTERAGRRLLLRAEAAANYLQTAGQRTAALSLTELQLVQGRVGCQRRWLRPVLEPCDLSMTYTGPEGEVAPSLLLAVNAASVRFSESTVSLLSQVVSEARLALSHSEHRVSSDTGSLPSSPSSENLWLPRSMEKPPTGLEPPGEHVCVRPAFPNAKPAETLEVHVPEVSVTFEREEDEQGFPVLALHAGLEVTVCNWSRLLYLKGEVRLQAATFSDDIGGWEPLLEPVMQAEEVYRPYEILFKLFRSGAHPISCGGSLPEDRPDGSARPPASATPSSVDTDDEHDHKMRRLRKPRRRSRRRRSSSAKASSQIVGTMMHSDSDSDDGLLERMAAAFGHLFSSDNDEPDGGEGEDADDSGPESVAGEPDPLAGQEAPDGPEVLVSSVTTGQLATYLLVESRDPLEVTVTPQSVAVLREVVSWTRDGDDETAPPRLCSLKPGVTINCQLGDTFNVTVLGKPQTRERGKVFSECMYGTQDVVPGSPTLSSPTQSVENCSRRLSSPGDTDVSQLLGGVLGAAVAPVRFREASLPELYDAALRQKLRIEAEGFEPAEVALPSRSVHRLVSLRRRAGDTVTTYQAVVQVTARGDHRSVSLTSPLQIKNGLSAPISLLYQRPELLGALADVTVGGDDDADSLEDVAVLAPGETAPIPLLVAYHCRLLLQPRGTSHDVSDEAIWWKDLVRRPGPHFLRCAPSAGRGYWVVAQLTVTLEAADEDAELASTERGMPVMTVGIEPAVIVHNHLPTAVLFSEYGAPAGGTLRLTSLDPTQKQSVSVQMAGYRDTRWFGKLQLSPTLRSGATVALTAERADSSSDGPNKLSLELLRQDASVMEFTLSVPYWLVNKTGRNLQVKVDSVPPEEPVLLRPRGSGKLRLSLAGSAWSPAFSVRAVETAGLVVCRDKERRRRHRVLMSVSLSHLVPTKIITFKPYFLLANQTRHHLMYMEEDEAADLWLDIAPRQVSPFWPATNSLRLSVKYRDSRVTSQWFSISAAHQTTLRMAGGGGLVVEVTGGVETPFLVRFEPYEPGDAPVRLENVCDDLFLKFHQASSGQVMLLGPYQSMLYTWEDPTAERKLLWNAYNSKAVDIQAIIDKDGFGEASLTLHTVRESRLARLSSRLRRSLNSSPRHSLGGSSTDDSDSEAVSEAAAEAAQRQAVRPRTRRDRTTVFWVSYMDGPQRALMFTQDERQALRVRQRVDGERAHLELFLSLRAAGLSLVTAGRRELLYASLRAPPSAWHVCVHDDWKPLSLEMSAWIEDKHSNDSAKASMKEYIEVDLSKMQMTRPFYGQLRRTQRPAVWLHLRRSRTLAYAHLRVHRPQVDCQIAGSVFPVVLHRVAPPRRVAERQGVAPFLEACVLRRDGSDSAPPNIRHLKLLVQEFSLEADKGLLVSLFDFVTPLLPPTPSDQTGLVQDLSIVHQPLVALSATSGGRAARSVFELVHLSPLKLSVSFSPRGAPLPGGSAGARWRRDLLAFLAESVGAPVTEFTDAELKLGFFERRGVAMAPADLWDEVKNHYKYQLLQEVYVLILGLDVLGNPYGLIKDFAHGVSDFFYEPYLGAMSGPEEFAEGVARGAQSLFGHVVGGAATSVSLLSETVGNMLSVLSFDEDYKRKRRSWMNQRGGLPETLLAAGRTFVMGIVLGLSGLVMQPIRGSQRAGVEGFFRGVGRGLLGLLTKPAGGVLDMVALAMDGVSRAVELGEQVTRARLPRHVNPQTGVRPFSPHAARGQYLLTTISEGRLARTDTYLAHAALSAADDSDICLVTDRHVLLLESSRFWGGWDIDWSVHVADLDGVPRIDGNRLVLKLRKGDSHDWFRVDQRELISEDAELLQWLQNKIERALLLGRW